MPTLAQIAEMRATPRNETLNYLADLVAAAYSPERTQQAQGIARFFAAPEISKTLRLLAYDEPLTTGAGGLGGTTKIRPEVLEAAMALAPATGTAYRTLEPAAMAAGRAGERYAEKVIPGILEKGGLPSEMAQAMGTNTLSRMYRITTPKKIDPSVGTRYEREYLGGLAEKTPINLEDYRGASVMIMPWDSTSRNYRITGISDEALKNPVITHGGQDYARDLAHIEQGIAGASNLGIAKRIRDRDAIARMENINAGGTGEILHLPTTMGAGSENFSVMPVDVLMNFADRANLSKSAIKEFDDSIRNFKIFKGVGEERKQIQPFKNFKGIMTEEGRIQMQTGEGINSTPGELRKAIVDRFYMKGNQERFGFNAEDVSAALTDPALMGVPKGYAGNTVIMTTPEGMHLRPSGNRTYNTDFTGTYQGTLGTNVPIEVLMPNRYQALQQEFAAKKGDVRNMAIGALQTRKTGISELIDDKVIENYYKYVKERNKRK